MLLYKDGITIEVLEADADRYLRAGYVKVEKPAKVEKSVVVVENKPARVKKAAVVRKEKVKDDA